MEIGRARFPALLNENVTMETPHRDRIGVCAKQLLLAEPRRENVCTVPGKKGAIIDQTDPSSFHYIRTKSGLPLSSHKPKRNLDQEKREGESQGPFRFAFSFPNLLKKPNNQKPSTA